MGRSAMPRASVPAAGPTIVAVDQPILDIIAPVTLSKLRAYGLEWGTQTLARPEHDKLYDEIEADLSTARVPGGSVLNSLRAATWWLREAGKIGSCAMVGAVGKDSAADILKAECTKEGITTRFMVLEEEPTGKCGILVHENTRTMLTCLGAAAKIYLGSKDAIEEHVVPLLGEKGRTIVISTAYYIVKDPNGGRRLVSECHGRYELALSLAATWAASLPIVAEVMRGCKMVFGTIDEVKAFAKANGHLGDCDDSAVQFLQARPGQPDRWAIITDGPRDVRFATSEGISRFPVPPIEKSLIIDDNGAGDSFAGAFLASYASGASVKDAMFAAMSTARVVMQNVGCQFEIRNEESPTKRGRHLIEAGC